jgi:hypothetical protein
MPRATRHSVKVADEVWIATALLHREHPERTDFAVDEIVERARREGLTRRLRPGVYVHAVQHCVADRPPNPGRYRMLVETAPNRRRLYRPGDRADPARGSAKIVPRRGEIPESHHFLLEWYESEYVRREPPAPEADPLLALRGSGSTLWGDEPADAYVRRLRAGWE